MKSATYNTEDADIILVAYGSMARVCESAMKMAREEGLKVGMIRPISLWPFPEEAFAGITGKKFLEDMDNPVQSLFWRKEISH